MLSPEELIRYSRHILLPELGFEGQTLLKKSSVLVVGSGGLGSPVLLYLTASGIGQIGIVDFDLVDESNLQRQVLFSSQDIGKRKVDAAIEHLSALNPHVKFNKYDVKLTSQNALNIAKDYDVVVDCSDNFPTRYLVNDTCVLLGKPFVFGAIYKFEGQVSVFNYKNGPTYRCLSPEYPDSSEALNCADIGVLGSVAGIIGCLQATEAIKIVAEVGVVLSGKLLAMDFINNTVNYFSIPKNNNINITELVDYEFHCNAHKIRNSVQSISVEELVKTTIPANELLIVDIRNSNEYNECHIPNSINIPMLLVENELDKIPRDKPVIIVCNFGKRSQETIGFLQDIHGYKNLKNLKGGFIEWLKIKQNV